MRLIFLLLLGLSFSARAELTRLSVKDLHFDYLRPHGTGVVEKLQIGLSESLAVPYPIEVTREENAMVLSSPVLDLSWQSPLPFIHNLEEVKVKDLDLHVERSNHSALTPELSFKTGKGERFFFKNVAFTCRGLSVQMELSQRLLEDCRESLKATITHLDVPLSKAPIEMAKELPEVEEVVEFPATDFALTLEKGDLAGKVRIKLLLKAHLWVWGHVDLGEGNKEIIIRMDKIKYGHIPVTNLVMKELKKRIEHPRVLINPPYIKIKLAAQEKT